VLRAGVLRVMEPAPPRAPDVTAWREVEARLRPFVARRVDGGDVDDVLQDVRVRIHRGAAAVRDEQRMSAWLYQVARSAIAEHGRARARHPLPASPDVPEAAADASDQGDDDPSEDVRRALVACVGVFVARLPSPYREAVTLVELEGLTAAEAAALAGISVSGMKSRVQRGRAQLRALFEACCDFEVDARGRVVDATPRATCGSGCASPRDAGRT
jgi:RNA polymerase sigma-70 factor (ECF subfamily)